MERKILPRPLQGRVAAIPSKSWAHRALICAALCQEPTELLLTATSQDIQATAACLRALGAQIETTSQGCQVFPIRQPAPSPTLDCGESGSTLRFLLPVAAALTSEAHFQGQGRLPERPLSPLLEALAAQGVSCPATALPLTIGHWSQGGLLQLPGSVSSQFASGLLLAAPLVEGGVEVRFTSPPQSTGYLDLTIHAMAGFGVQVQATPQGYVAPAGQRYRSPGRIKIEGDWSNAAFWLVAGALTTTGLTVSGLDPASAQGDRQIVAILQEMGAHLRWQGDELTAQGTGRLQAVSIDAAHIPDLAPILAVAAAMAQGTTVIRQVERLRWKESDRLATTIQLIRDLGGQAQAEGDCLYITGVEQLRGGSVQAHNDHRIAMSAAIAATACREPVLVQDSQAVEKSYPHFWTDYASLGGVSHVI